MTIADIWNDRPRLRAALAIYYNRGDGSDGAVTVSASSNFSAVTGAASIGTAYHGLDVQELQCTSFTLNSSTTLTLDKPICIVRATGTITINGTVQGAGLVGANASTGSNDWGNGGNGRGGDGGRGASADGDTPFVGFVGTGPGLNGRIYNGPAAHLTAPGGGCGAVGGGGGTGLYVGRTVRWLEWLLDDDVSRVITGTGGCGGGSSDGRCGGGGGGGGAGFVCVASKIVIASTAVLTFTGGNGGDGGTVSPGNGGDGGAGGSGGAILFQAANIEWPTSGTIATMTGGTGGAAGGGVAVAGGSGGNGLVTCVYRRALTSGWTSRVSNGTTVEMKFGRYGPRGQSGLTRPFEVG